MADNEDFFEEPKSWSHLKHSILKYYLREYFHKVNRHYRKGAVAADLFAGAGLFDNGEEGSPLIIARYAHEANLQNGVTNRVILAEVRPDIYAQLSRNMEQYTKSGLVTLFEGEAKDVGCRLLDAIPAGTPLFLFLDPFGNKGLSMELIQQILSRAEKESTEILVNFSEKSLRRRIGVARNVNSQDDRSRAYALDAVELLNDALGGEWWKEILQANEMDEDQKLDLITSEYITKFTRAFRFVGIAPVTKGYPDEEVKYHLIFGSRSWTAFELMNNSVNRSAAEFLLSVTKAAAIGTLFEEVGEEYVPPKFRIKPVVLRNEVYGKCISYVQNIAASRSSPEAVTMNRATARRLVIEKNFAKYSSSDINKAIRHLVKNRDLVTANEKKAINDKDEFTVVFPPTKL